MKVFSRMLVVDGATRMGALKEASLPFEGFLECLSRLSALMALPTDEELEEAQIAGDEDEEAQGFISPCEDAGDYLLRLRERDAAAYARFLEERATRWGMPPRQPVHSCVAKLLSLVIRTIEEATPGKDNLDLTQHEADEWVRRKCGLAKVR